MSRDNVIAALKLIPGVAPMVRYFKAHWAHYRWIRQGRPFPMPARIKQRIILDYGKRFGLRTLVETGTYYGDTIEIALKAFDRVTSIELSPELSHRARVKFRAFSHVEILEGDSAVLLPRVVAGLQEPALFWLDAHYAGPGTARGQLHSPILHEIAVILAQSIDHVVLIDDARNFTGAEGYPELHELEQLVRARKPQWAFRVADDIIRLTPE